MKSNTSVKLRLTLIAAIATIVLGVSTSSIGAEPNQAKGTEPRSTVAIRDVRVFDGESVIPKASVVFTEGIITAVGTDIEIPSDAKVIDGRGKTLLPGLIDAHTHSWGDALERALVFGVTTEIDMFTSPAFANPAREAQRKGPVTSRADLVSAGILVTVPGGHGSEYFPIPTIDATTDIQKFVDDRIAEGSDFIKIVYDDGSAYEMSFPTFDYEMLKKVIAAAHARDMMAVVHIGTLQGAREAIEAGADGLVHLFRDRAPDPTFATLAKERNVFVISTTTVIESTTGHASGASLIDDPHVGPYLVAAEKTNLKASFPRKVQGDDYLEPTFEAIRKLASAGVPILAGSDAPNPGTIHGASIHRELELLVEAGLTPLEALASATSVPASTFHLDDRGRIAAGMRADLVLVNGDPTEDILSTRNIASIWKAGSPLARKPVETSSTSIPAPFTGSEWGLVSNFDDGTTTAEFGSGWMISTDQMIGGKSTVSYEVVAGALRIDGTMASGSTYPWAGAMFLTGKQQFEPANLSSKSGIRFRVKGDGRPGVLMVFAQRLGRLPATKSFDTSDGWTTVEVAWKDLGDLDGSDIQGFLISGSQSPGDFEMTIDDVELFGASQ